MNRRVILGLAPAVLALAYCAPAPKPPPVLQLTIAGSADQNPDASGKAAPVAVRVYQLGGTAKFEQTDVFALMDNAAKILGADLVGSQEFLIAPSETKKVTIDLKPMVSAIGVAVMYRDIDNAKWRATAKALDSGPTRLSATVGKLTLTLKTEN